MFPAVNISWLNLRCQNKLVKLKQIVQFVANLAMITALKCSGLSHAFRCVVEKNKNAIHQLRWVHFGKNCALCLKYRPRPAALGGIQDLRHSFS